MAASDGKLVFCRGAFDINPSLSTGLYLRVGGGVLLNGLGYQSIQGEHLLLDDNTTNYVEVSDAGVLSANSSAFSSGATYLYEVVTSGGVVITIKDWRYNTEVDPVADLGQDGTILTAMLATAAVTGPKLAVGSLFLETAVTVDHADASPKEIVAADASNDRIFLVALDATEAAAGEPDVDIGTTNTIDAVVNDFKAGAWVIGDKAMKLIHVPATENLRATIAAAGTAGKIKVYTQEVTPIMQTANIADAAVTLAKMAHMATDSLLGRDTAAAGDVEVISLGAGLSMSGAGALQVTEAGYVASLLTSALGGSHSVIKSETGTHTVVAAHGSKDRACVAVGIVDETFANGDTSQTVVELGETDTIDKMWDHTKFVNAAAGTVFVGAFTNTATKAIVATSTAAAGTGTGGVTFVVLAIPTT